jgi:hypothetical protein
LAEARVRVAAARGLAADMVHTDPAAFEADRRQGSVLLNSAGEVADRWGDRTVGWPLRVVWSRNLWEEYFATPARHSGFRTAADLDETEAQAWHWARGEGAHPHPGVD